jgi:hypothetical protein
MRRTFRRHIRKTLAQEVPPILQEANFAFDKGEYGRAGELFEKIADTVSVRGGVRAPLFYLQAGRARTLAAQIHLAMPSWKRGLELLAQRGAWNKFQQAGERAIAELLEYGFAAESQELKSFLNHLSPREIPWHTLQPLPIKKPTLLTHCSACGAAIRADEVEWPDEATAECAFCGNPLRS